MYTPVTSVEVRIWDQYVGAVALDPRLQFYVFQFAPRFITSGIEIAPFHMPLSKAQSPFVFTDLPEITFKRLPALLADSLPDDFGNSLINAWMGSQGVHVQDITPLDRLAYMGARGFGALEFRPARGPRTQKSTAINLAKLVESARSAIHEEIDTDAHAKAALQQIIQVGTSAGGARAKAAVAWNATKNELRAGQFDVDTGFEHWLLKFDGMGKDLELGESEHYGRIEYAYHLMACAAGINMAPCRLLEENGRAHFMTRRFDRDGNTKHHLQTLCAMAHLDFKQSRTHDYSQALLAINQLGLGYPAREEMFRRAVFNVMAANCDDHTKNTSFIFRQGIGWSLAPAYDLTHAHNPKGVWTYQHLMSVNGKFSGITKDDFLKMADLFGIGTASQVLRDVRTAVIAWPEYAAAAQLNPGESDRVKADHKTDI